jgi:dihydrofolate reductase
MGKIAATLFISLDGVVGEPQEWSFPYWGDETSAYKDAELRASGAQLLGRFTYEGFAAAWPSRTGEFADKFNRMPKYVASSTLKSADWTNAHVLRGDLAAEIRKARDKTQGELTVHGSPTLVRWLLAHELLDELRLLTYPIVLGKGKRLFDGAAPANLRFVSAKPLSGGTVLLTYESAGKPTQGSIRAAGAPS